MELVNQIAAGEVIERPASAVKELVENCLDAGATRITIEIEAGGKRLIRISDDGRGITPDDLPLAIAPHATSKLHTAEDLFRVQTLGFRGEALASIASISELRLVSRPVGQEVGASIQVGGAHGGEVRPAGAALGTAIEVRELFFNTPARRKFLKSERSESAAVAEQVLRIALAYPAVSFTLKSEGRTVYDLPAVADLQKRLGDLFGRELIDGLLPVAAHADGLDLTGFAGKPIEARPTARWQYLTVNGRFVRDRHVSAAIKEAYHGLIDFNRYPTYFLFLTIDPARVDVNVHPTKMEVRFQEADRVRGLIYHAVKQALLDGDLVADLRMPEKQPQGGGSWSGRTASFGSGFTSSPLAPRTSPFPGPTPVEQHRIREAVALELTRELQSAQHRMEFGQPPLSVGEGRVRAETLLASEENAAPAAAAFVPAPRAMQVLRTYLVAEDGDGLLIFDQHALHERVLYQEFWARLSAGPLQGQRMLVPEPLKVTPSQAAAAEEHGELLHRLGIELAPFGPGQLAVHCFPVFLQRLSAGEFVGELLEKLSDAPASLPPEEILHRVVDMMACKAAVKAGDLLTPAEMQALLDSAGQAERSAHCPHGRPTMLRLSRHDLERQFHRIK